MHVSGWFTQAVCDNAVGPIIVNKKEPSVEEEEKYIKRAKK